MIAPLLAPLLWLASLLHAPTAGEVVQLDWSAPDTCPGASQVREQIDLNLAGDQLGPAVGAVRVRGAIEAVADGWELRIDTTLPQGVVSRTLVAPECAQLAEAAGLVVAVALDPLAVVETRREPAPVAASPEPEVRAVQPATRPAPVIVSDDSAREIEPVADTSRPSFDVRAGGLGELGSFDVVRGGVWLGLGWAWRRARLDVAGQYWAPRAVRAFDAQPDAGVVVQQGGVAVRGCYVRRLGAAELPTCAGLEAGAARGRGVGLANPRTTHPPWAAVTLGQELAWSSRRGLGLWLAADVMIHLVRPSFRVRDLGIGARTHPVGFRVVLGPSWRL